jgi:hypothetical protein
MITIALCLAANGMVALSFECVGAALEFFGLCGPLVKLGEDRPALRKMGPPFSAEIPGFLQKGLQKLGVKARRLLG